MRAPEEWLIFTVKLEEILGCPYFNVVVFNIVIIIITIWKAELQKKRRKGEKKIFYPLVHSSNGAGAGSWIGGRGASNPVGDTDSPDDSLTHCTTMPILYCHFWALMFL